MARPNIMREPARLHITWSNDSTLKVEIDAGKQTRLFLFGPAPASAQPSMQGTSVALWQTPQSIRAYTSKISAQDPNTPGFRDASMASPPPPPDTRRLGGTLKVVTTHIQPGYLRNNGVPFSANAVLTEYYDLHKLGNERIPGADADRAKIPSIWTPPGWSAAITGASRTDRSGIPSPASCSCPAASKLPPCRERGLK